MNETYRKIHEERERQILDTAKEMILKNGPDGITKVELAEALGVSRVTLHKYFKSIDEIIVAIANEINATTMKVEHFLFPDGKTLSIEEGLREFLYYAFEHKEDLVFGMYLDLYLKKKDGDPLYSDIYEANIKSEDTLPLCVKRYQEKGMMRDDIDAEQLAFTLNYIILGALDRMIIIGEAPHRYLPLSREDYIESIIEMTMGYVQPQNSCKS